jgi:hypothetical protein
MPTRTPRRNAAASKLPEASAADEPPEAVRMIELLSGDSGSLECFHALRKHPKSAHHMHGALTNRKVAERLMKLNLSGHDIYMTAHLLHDGVERNPVDEDVARGRALFIDSDGAPKPDCWHLPPDFLLEREDDPGHNWWAFWVIASGAFPPDAIEGYQKRVAAQYQTDSSVSDRRRIVRLPGYVRHKANEGPGKKNKAKDDTSYRLVEGAGR